MAGGQADKEVINSAEVYVPELNQWEQITSRMESPRVGLAMVSIGNLIYVMGTCTSQLDVLLIVDLKTRCLLLKLRCLLTAYFAYP